MGGERSEPPASDTKTSNYEESSKVTNQENNIEMVEKSEQFSQEIQMTREPLKGFECPQCKLMFLGSFGLEALKSHMTKSQCQLIASSKIESEKSGNLKKHVKAVHKEVIDHICNHCGKSFSSLQHLRTHIIKDHVCNHCCKSFSSPERRDIHVRTVHEGVKDHICNHCEKSFSTFQSLKLNVQTVHEGVKGHVCNHCGMRFSQAGSFKTHCKAVHEHLCNLCDKSFYLLKHLKTHIKVDHKGMIDHVSIPHTRSPPLRAGA